jgi:hypothetical protein
MTFFHTSNGFAEVLCLLCKHRYPQLNPCQQKKDETNYRKKESMCEFVKTQPYLSSPSSFFMQENWKGIDPASPTCTTQEYNRSNLYDSMSQVWHS